MNREQSWDVFRPEPFNRFVDWFICREVAKPLRLFPFIAKTGLCQLGRSVFADASKLHLASIRTYEIMYGNRCFKIEPWYHFLTMYNFVWWECGRVIQGSYGNVNNASSRLQFRVAVRYLFTGQRGSAAATELPDNMR